MNKNELSGVVRKNGDTFTILADVLGITPQTFSKKINEVDGAEFKQGEIAKIKERYQLTPEEVNTIFFSN